MARSLFVFLVACFFSPLSFATDPGALTETRYCGEPKRDADGRIKRSSAVAAAFQRIHPCPSTHLTFGPCPGWKKDHVVSLGARHPTLGGGCDSVSNMQWLPDEIKLCSQFNPFNKDCWELWVYSLTKGGQ